MLKQVLHDLPAHEQAFEFAIVGLDNCVTPVRVSPSELRRFARAILSSDEDDRKHDHPAGSGYVGGCDSAQPNSYTPAAPFERRLLISTGESICEGTITKIVRLRLKAGDAYLETPLSLEDLIDLAAQMRKHRII